MALDLSVQGDDRSLPVSVILPTHNRAEVLPRAIRSVLAQTRPPRELIVVDDASSDDIASIVASFESPHVRYIRMPEQGGPGHARNHGVELAQYEWVAFQDSDDEWLINKLEVQWEAASKGSADVALVCGAYIIVPRRGAPWLVGPSAPMLKHPWSAEARFEFPFIAPTWLLRRETFLGLRGFDTSLPNLEDWEFSFRVHDRGRVIALQEALLVKHGSSDGLNKDVIRQLESLRRIRTTHNSLLASSQKNQTRFLLRLAYFHARLSDGKSVRLAMREAFACNRSGKILSLYAASLLGLRAFRFVYRKLFGSGPT